MHDTAFTEFCMVIPTQDRLLVKINKRKAYGKINETQTHDNISSVT